MTSHFLNIVFSPSVKEVQQQNGSRGAYARRDGAIEPDRLTESEAAFIAMRDSFYLASVGADRWPYIQHRGGLPGFVKVLNDRAIGFADYRGNRQYVSVGNVSDDNRVALFMMDYPRQARLKLLGRARVVDLASDPALAEALVDRDYAAKVERGIVIDIEAFDWNCPQYITPRYTLSDMHPTITALKTRIAELEAMLETRAPNG